MDEHLRIEYLTALGIDMYIPRRQLPGARPSPVAVGRPSLTSAPASSPRSLIPESPAERMMTRGNEVGIHQLVDALVEDKTTQRQLAPSRVEQQTNQRKQQQPETATVDSATIRFVLNCWRVSPDLMVIDSHQPGRALPTGTLLGNILRAIGLPASLPPADTLRWPVIRQSEARLTDAREMVAGFLAGHMQARPAKSVWLLGEAAVRACTDCDMPMAECLGKELQLPSLEAPALALPSLLEMLVDPRLKVVTWHAIRRFHVRN